MHRRAARILSMAGGALPALLFAPISSQALAQTPAPAETLVVRLVDGQSRPLSALATGEQGMVSRQSGEIAFAGRRVQLDDFVGIAGYASEVAYLIVLDGEAEAGEAQAGAGQMLLLPPFGGAPMVERFDAARLRRDWPPPATAAAPEAQAALEDIVRSQSFARFFGRYRPTRFNVAASGAARSEMTRRQLVGGPVVRAIRFSGDAAPTTTEYRVIVALARALAEADAASVAQLLDPVPFGGAGMGEDGAAARLMLARSIVAQRDWRRRLRGLTAMRGTDINQWLLSGPEGLSVVTLRPTPDFAFVAAIETESTP